MAIERAWPDRAEIRQPGDLVGADMVPEEMRQLLDFFNLPYLVAREGGVWKTLTFYRRESDLPYAKFQLNTGFSETEGGKRVVWHYERFRVGRFEGDDRRVVEMTVDRSLAGKRSWVRRLNRKPVKFREYWELDGEDYPKLLLWLEMYDGVTPETGVEPTFVWPFDPNLYGRHFCPSQDKTPGNSLVYSATQFCFGEW